MRAWLALLIACGGAAPPAEPLPQPQPIQHTPAPHVPATVEQCDRLLAKLLDLDFRKLGPPDPASLQTAIDSKRDEFRAVCTQVTSATRVECALAATDLAGIEKCDETP